MRPRRDRSDLDETKAEPEQRVRDLRILVKAGGKTDRVRKLESKRAHGQFVPVGWRPGEGHDPQRLNGEPVRVFRIECTQERVATGGRNRPINGRASVA